MIPFDIMTTATLRPELLKRTFDSHIELMFKDSIKAATLNINIDKTGCPIEEQDQRLKEIMDYITSIKFRKIRINVSTLPHFPSAFCWCLDQLGEPLTFNLEEDWELKTQVPFNDLLTEFEMDRELVHLRLSCFSSNDQYQLKTWNKHCFWNGRYYQVPENLRGTIGWAGHPSLNRTSFLLHFKRQIDRSSNPEKQIKGRHPIILNSNFGVYQKPFGEATVKDIGREWMQQNGWKKKGVKAFFTQWEKVS